MSNENTWESPIQFMGTSEVNQVDRRRTARVEITFPGSRPFPQRQTTEILVSSWQTYVRERHPDHDAHGTPPEDPARLRLDNAIHNRNGGFTREEWELLKKAGDLAFEKWEAEFGKGDR